MESHPFPDRSFDGGVSQFGIEYSDLPVAARELARVLEPGAPVAFVAHHADSPLLAHNHRRGRALEALTADLVGSSFLSGDRGALGRALGGLPASYGDQGVVAEFSAGLGQALALGPAERRQLWGEVTAKAAHERAILGALEAAAVKDIGGWLEVFGRRFSFETALAITDRAGRAFAWSVKGRRT